MDGEGERRPEWIDRLRAQAGEPVIVQLSVEQGVAFPVEVFDEHGPGFVGPRTLGLSQQLERDLTAWLRWWQQHASPTGDAVVAGDDAAWRRWDREGDRLRQELQQELGREFRVLAS